MLQSKEKDWPDRYKNKTPKAHEVQYQKNEQPN